MNGTSFSDRVPEAASARSRLLAEIADALGVSTEVFAMPAPPCLLHAGEDGACWLLALDAQGAPVVRRTDKAGRGATEESVPDFLAHDPGSPAHRALTALVDRLLIDRILAERLLSAHLPG